jgi:hypothetical protein
MDNLNATVLFGNIPNKAKDAVWAAVVHKYDFVTILIASLKGLVYLTEHVENGLLGVVETYDD